ncbi:MAG: hypothetical protein U0169_11140 [Polyangiaceae bacterium]
MTRPCLAIPAARLVYVRGSGAESCPDEDELRRAVATRLGYDPFFPTASSTLIADVERAKGRFVAHIKLVGDDDVTRGARRLEHGGPSCADMIDTMALSISIAIDPESLTRAPRPDPVPAADSSADRAPPVSPGATTAREAAIEPVGGGPARARPKEDLAIPRSESISYRIEAGGGVLGAVGAAPATNVGVEAFARWRSGRPRRRRTVSTRRRRVVRVRSPSGVG